MLDIIRYSLWGKKLQDVLPLKADHDDYEEMKKHAIAALSAPILSNISLSPELKSEWHAAILQQIAYYVKYRHIQTSLPITVPYVILKGTAASQYYPYPELRAMGDIDIITRREDFAVAYQELLDEGYKVIKELKREIGLTKNGVIIELHRYFSVLLDPEKAQYLDDLIIDNIQASHLLPDLINGLVLLEHIDQHLEGGIGLRQIIDWMMFVDKCLSDENWEDFKPMVQKIGLEKLAITTTQMCVMYLGLSSREWCLNADKRLCRQLMDYVLSCGNFGIKRTEDSNKGEAFFFRAQSPKAFFELLQERGLINWKASQQKKILQPFAWLYQLFRYGFRGFGRREAFQKLIAEHEAAMKRKKLFDALEIKQTSEGHMVFYNGQYIKK